MVDYLPTVLTLVAFALHVLGERRAVVLTGRPRDRPRSRARADLLRRAADDPDRAPVAARHARRPAVLGAHDPAPAAARGRRAADRARPARGCRSGARCRCGFRRALARTAMRSPYLAPLRALCRALTRPAGAWFAFNLNLLFWHLPGPYDLTLRNLDVHVLEHSTFLIFGILFWAQVIGVAPASVAAPAHAPDRLRRRRDRAERRAVDVPRVRPASALQPLCDARPPAGRHLRAGRPADRRGNHVGCGRHAVRDRDRRARAALARACRGDDGPAGQLVADSLDGDRRQPV